MSRFGRTRWTSTIFVVLASGLLLAASRNRQQPNGTITSRFQLPDNLWRHPVMVAAIRDGAVVYQEESPLPNDNHLSGDMIRPGLYDVRVEGEGIVTEVKRGVRLYPGRELNLYFNIRPGAGLHTVEYTTTALSREEIALRLSRLEAAVAELRKSLAAK
jgi:hypothetical protein